jgi:hypothetical protein
VSRALLLLVRLQAYGWLRFLVRNLRTVKGAILAVVGLLVFVPWILTLVAMPEHTPAYPPEKLRLYGPAILLAYCVLNVLTSSGERAVYFTPAEVQFLFAAPFGRRELLGYKVFAGLVISLPSALILTLVFQAHARWWAAAFVALVLLLLFTQLFGMALNLAVVAAGERLRARVRLTVVLAAALLAALVYGGTALSRAEGGWLERAQGSAVWRALSWPLAQFVECFLADDVAGLLLHGAAALAVDGLLLLVVFAVDADYLEATAASSARIYAQIQRLRGVAGAGAQGDEAPGAAPPARARLGLPMPPALGGVGPQVWRQLTTALRQPARLVVLAVTFGLLMLAMAAGARGGESSPATAVGVGVGMMLWVAVFLTALVPFDFRGDVDRLALLKTLPVPAWRLALGQVLAPALLLTLLNWLGLLALLAGVAWRALGGEALERGSAALLVAGLAFAPAFNFLLMAVENLLFLLFPVRLTASPGDFQALGRNVLFMLAKMLLLVVVGGGAALAGFVVFLVTGRNVPLGVAAAWLVVACAGAALLWPIALAFNAFDVGRETPA